MDRQSSHSGFFSSFFFLMASSGLLSLILILFPHHYDRSRDLPGVFPGQKQHAKLLTQVELWKPLPAQSQGARESLRYDLHDEVSKDQESSDFAISSEDLLAAAMSRMQNSGPDGAIAMLEQILIREPGHEAALTELGMIYLMEYQEPSKALDYFKQVLMNNPGNQVVISEVISLSYDGEISTDISSLFEELHQKYPEHAGLSLGIGQLLINQQQYAQAIPFLEKAAASSQMSSSLTELASAYSQAGFEDKAIVIHKKNIRLKQEHVAATYGQKEGRAGQKELFIAQADLLEELLRQGKNEEAVSYYQQLGREYGAKIKELNPDRAMKQGSDPSVSRTSGESTSLPPEEAVIVVD
ncbi:MAG: tetratricopeptide repeat protein [Deltaproteobacteria bacterium]|nr:tetratricopeptide repeat protein [Deltaproteobacteria bacterium]